MKILVFSDTHGDSDSMLKILEKTPCDMLLHLGDSAEDCREPRAMFRDVFIRQVAGNSYSDILSQINTEDVFEAGGLRIFMTHGHRFNVRSGIDALSSYAAARGADIALYGHTHIARTGEYNGVFCMNPGSASRARSSSGQSYGLLIIENKKFTCEVIRF